MPDWIRLASVSTVLATLACAFAGALACAGWARHTISECPGPATATSETTGDFWLRARMRFVAEGVDFPLDVVAQRRAGELVVIGWNPFGAKLFTLVQSDEGLEIDALPRAVMPVAPVNVLRDLDRAGLLRTPPSGFERDPVQLPHPQCGYHTDLVIVAHEVLP
jgi:hypothetical protein